MTLIRSFLENVERFPDRVALRFLSNGVDESTTLTYSELNSEILKVSSVIQHHSQIGDRILLQHNIGPKCIISFLASLYSGCIPISYPVFRNRDIHHELKKFDNLCKDAQPKIVLCDLEIRNRLKIDFIEDRLKNDMKKKLNLGSSYILNAKKVVLDEENINNSPDLRESTELKTAYLQYTSGSTGNPKGVMISHDNLIKHLKAFQSQFPIKECESIVNWLPYFHDFGLVAMILYSLFNGNSLVLMSPATFVSSPLSRLKALEKYNGVYTGTPNFGISYCNQMISEEEVQELDLRNLKWLFCGAEPINPYDLITFSKKFKSCFNKNPLVPGYGLAENTLIASMHFDFSLEKAIKYLCPKKLKASVIKEKKKGHPIVSCGKPFNVNEIIIYDELKQKKCKENEIGEVLVKSPFVCSGYWNNQEGSEKIFFHADLKTKPPFLKTGDLGYISSGLLYILGRKKDLIIIRGLNYYPSDIEQAILEDCLEIKTNCCCVFSFMDDENEKLVVVFEVKRTHLKSDLIQLIKNVQYSIINKFEIAPSHVFILKPTKFFKTSSGKVQRSGCKKAFLEGKLEYLEYWEKGKFVKS